MVSPPGMVTLTDLEHDAFTELVNLGVSRAALSLREMIGEQVLLSVPAVGLVTRQRAIEILGERAASMLVVVHEAFEGDITGRALLIFPESQSLDLVRYVVGKEMPLEDLVDLETEALAEIGNIILGNCLSTIANMFQRHLRLSMPEVLRGSVSEMLSLTPPPEAGELLLFLYINFNVRGRDVSGYIAMTMDMPTLAVLKQLIDEFIERTTGGAAAQPDHTA